MRKILTALFLLWQLTAFADINITNIPPAAGVDLGDTALGVTNSNHAALIPLGQISALVQGDFMPKSNRYNGSFSGDGILLTNLSATNLSGTISLGTLPSGVLTNNDTRGWTNTGNNQFTGNVSINGTLVLTNKVTSYASAASDSVLKLGSIELQPFGVGNSWFSDNVYFDGAAFKVRATGSGTLFYMSSGGLSVRTVPSTSAGTGVTPTQRFWVSQLGAVALGGSQTFASTAGGNFQLDTNGNATLVGTLTATNGVNLMVKPSFTTNFTCTTNLQVYLCNGTNQTVTLPNAAYVPNVIYRFACTNGWAKFTITNATGAQTIRDGTSLSFTQVGIGSPAFFSDGAHWWPAARTKIILPNAQFACSTNIPLTVANSNYPVTFDSIANESQGISLGTNGNGAWSVMWITNSGQYEFIPSIIERFSANHIIRYWFKSNGTNIPNSQTPAQGAAGGTTIRVITMSYKTDVTAPTAFEIWAQSDNTGDDLYSETASGNYPAAPSVICPVKKISDPWP